MGLCTGDLTLTSGVLGGVEPITAFVQITVPVEVTAARGGVISGDAGPLRARLARRDRPGDAGTVGVET
jgi:hypothetical protein